MAAKRTNRKFAAAARMSRIVIHWPSMISLNTPMAHLI